MNERNKVRETEGPREYLQRTILVSYTVKLESQLWVLDFHFRCFVLDLMDLRP